MHIDKLTIENWKCFSEELSLSFSNIEILSFPNGSGKTSILEAILYAMYGKTEGKLSSYQNHDGQTKVSISFNNDGVDYEINREFPNTLAQLKANGEVIRNGIREVFDYMNSMLNYDITKRLWFKGDISDSEILNFNFFKNNILSEKLSEPIALQKFYTQEGNQKKKQLKNLSLVETRDIKIIDEEIAGITSKIKDRTNINDFEYTRAVTAKEADKKLHSLKLEAASKGVKLVSEEEISKWKSIDLDREQQRYDEEMSKTVDDILSGVGNRVLSTIVRENDSHKKCIVCDGEWGEDRSSYIKEIVSNGLRDSSIIADCLEKINFKNNYTEYQIEKSNELIELTNTVNLSPNYQEKIDSFNKENDKLWDILDSLNKERESAIRNKTIADQINKLESEIAACQEKVTFIKDYLDKATESYTSSLLKKSSEILNSLNPDYTNVSISAEDSSIEVTVRGDKLFVHQLSRGEKTMLALSLIYTIRDLFTPGMPLMFDESFASLSRENNYKVISFIKDSYEQLFIISHNPEWIDYPKYPSGTNIRTTWESN